MTVIAWTGNVRRIVDVEVGKDGVACAFVGMMDPRRNKHIQYAKVKRAIQEGFNPDLKHNPSLPQNWYATATAYQITRTIWRFVYNDHIEDKKRNKVTLRECENEKDVVDALVKWGRNTKHLIATCKCEGE